MSEEGDPEVTGFGEEEEEEEEAPEEAAPAPEEAGHNAEEARAATEPAAPEEAHHGADGGSFKAYIQSVDICKAYEDACKAGLRKVNACVRRSLHDSVQAAKDTFFIEAPGNDKLTFTNRLTDDDMQIFAQVFMTPSVFLQRLDLSYNHLTDVGATELAQTILAADNNTRRLTSLNLRSNSIGPDGCFAICQAVVMCQTLRRLNMSQNPLGREGGLLVVDLLRNSPDLLELHLEDTEADIDVLVATAEALLNPELHLKVCNLQNPRIITLQEDHTVHLGRMLRVNTHLSEINLGKIKMRDEGVRQLVSFLLENKTLRILDLRCNELGAAGAKHIGVLLGSDCQLSHLNLSGNRIGEQCNVTGATAIAQALLNNRMLRHLDLDHNALCGGSLKVLADAVDQNSMLETIALFNNQWDQPSSYKFHQILSDRARVLPLRADFVTSEVDLRIDICKVNNFVIS